MDLEAFARAYQASFEAQVAMFPAMMAPGVSDYIDRYRDKALAWKMSAPAVAVIWLSCTTAHPSPRVRSPSPSVAATCDPSRSTI